MANKDGHRSRMKQRYLETGLVGFDDVSTLELLLQYAIPRQDTKPIAQELLGHFGSLATVMEAPIVQLTQVKGIGDSAAILIHLVNQVARRHMIQRATFDRILCNTTECGEYLVPFFFGSRDEVVYLLCLDSKCMVLDCQKIGEGGVNSTGVSLRKIVERALSCNATSVVLSHNHTNGVAIPSIEDQRTTQFLRHGLEVIGLHLADHIIVAGEDFISMKESGFFDKKENANGGVWGPVGEKFI